MFSPVQSNLIAAAGTGGTRLFDIRHNQIGYIPINSTVFKFVAVILKTIYVLIYIEAAICIKMLAQTLRCSTEKALICSAKKELA